MTGNETTERPFLQGIRGETPGKPPIWLMRQAGRYLPEYRELRTKAASFLDFCYTPEMAVEATLQPIRRYGLDAAILFSDILVIPDAMGQDVSFVEGKGPVLEPITRLEEIGSLKSHEDVTNYLAPVYTTVKTLRAELPAETALIGFAGAPWTIASYMLEGGGGHNFAQAKQFMWRESAAFQGLMDRLCEAIAHHLVEQVRAGADAVMLFDSWAGALPDLDFRRWSIGSTKLIIDRFRASCPDIPVIGFPRLAGQLYGEYRPGTGVDVMALDTSVPIEAMVGFQADGPVQGNLDPQALVAGGSVMKDYAERLVRKLSGGAHIFNLGHGVVPETPPDHVAELVDIVRQASAS